MRRCGLLCLTLAAVAAISVQARADSTSESSQAFLTAAFPNGVPKPKMIWYSGALGKEAASILGHRPRALRQRYWLDASTGRSAWILDEVGKERPITFGILIEHDRIARLRVLRFRESRGGEIQFPFFTAQFHQARLQGKQLDRTIDGISGATLSVRAAKKVARLALFLHRAVIDHEDP